ncbi:MAG: GntR family transcriptional regulator [Clostridia bacterium]|nr:GntR family transcriptional regulator [Clostridia bacterium]
MQILIRNASGQPIYEQIYRQIRDQILSGTLAEGELLPSIRALAKDLRISVITTKRAYDELEKDGLIVTVAGKGCFVAPKNLEMMREEHLKQIEQHLRAVIQLARPLELSYEDILEMLKLIDGEAPPGAPE